ATIPGGRGAPARVVTPKLASVEAEFGRARKLVADLKPAPHWHLAVSGNGTGAPGTEDALKPFLAELSADAKLTAGEQVESACQRQGRPGPAGGPNRAPRGPTPGPATPGKSTSWTATHRRCCATAISSATRRQ